MHYQNRDLKKFPGLKQHVPLSTDGPETKKDYQDYDSAATKKIAQDSYHGMSINLCVTTKTGPGPKFFQMAAMPVSTPQSLALMSMETFKSWL